LINSFGGQSTLKKESQKTCGADANGIKQAANKVDGCQHLSKSNALFLEFGPKLRVYSLFLREKELFLRGTLKEIGESKALFLAIIIWWSANPRCKKRKQAVKVARNIKHI
jgi:hypothetical protein